LVLKTLAIKLYWQLHAIYAPETRFAQELYADVLFRYVRRDTDWLDLGCGRKLLPEWYGDREALLVATARHITGIDYDCPSLCAHSSIRKLVRGDISALPFATGSFSLVTANMVVEHLAHPAKTFAEVNRVLVPKGRFIFITPNALGYITALTRLVPSSIRPRLAKLLENRSQEDVFPTLYRANHPRTIKRLAAVSGFVAEELRLVTSAGMPQLALYPPLSILELMWINLLESELLRIFRQNIIVVLRKAQEPG
jgi:SAM-dependent methyltransferase